MDTEKAQAMTSRGRDVSRALQAYGSQKHSSLRSGGWQLEHSKNHLIREVGGVKGVNGMKGFNQGSDSVIAVF